MKLSFLISTVFFLIIRRPPSSTLFPYRRSSDLTEFSSVLPRFSTVNWNEMAVLRLTGPGAGMTSDWPGAVRRRSEEHTSELQSQSKLVCRLLLEKKNLGLELFVDKLI